MLSFGDWDSSDMAAVKDPPDLQRLVRHVCGNPTLDYALRWHLYKWLKDRDSPRSMPEMMDGLRHAYDAERKKVLDRHTQALYGCNHDVLLSTGRQRFGDPTFAQVISEVTTSSISTQSRSHVGLMTSERRTC